MQGLCVCVRVRMCVCVVNQPQDMWGDSVRT